jgi:hypothetical protein
MAILQVRTFKDIQDSIMESLQIQSTDSVTRNRIKRDINLIYEEVLAFKDWSWARGYRQLQVEPYYSSGTATVATGSNEVTLSGTITSSKKGYNFSIDGHNEVYRIESHTAGTATLKLETVVTGTSGSFSFKIWSDIVALPTEARDVVEVRHDYSRNPLENYGLQEYRRLTAGAPKADGRPWCFTVTDWEDPASYDSIASLPAAVSRTSAGRVKTLTFASSVTSFFTAGDYIEVSECGDFTYNGEWIVSSVSGSTITFTATSATTESAVADTAFVVKARNTESYEQFRKMLVYPSISNMRTMIHVDYIRNAPPLEEDTDEPIIPRQHRRVLLYGASWLAWKKQRNEEESDKYYALYQQTLAQIAGKTESSPDKPVMRMSRAYLQTKRFPIRNRVADTGTGNGGGGSGGGSVTGTSNSVATFNNLGDLVGSSVVDTNELAYLDGAVPLTTTTLTNNTTTTMTSWVAADYTAAIIHYSFSRGSIYGTGTLHVSSDGSICAISASGSETAASGITFDAVVLAGNVTVQGILDNAGNDASVKYRSILWSI